MTVIKTKTMYDNKVTIRETASGMYVVTFYFMGVELDSKSFITESGAKQLFTHWTRDVHAE